jgi:hypothetical protein
MCRLRGRRSGRCLRRPRPSRRLRSGRHRRRLRSRGHGRRLGGRRGRWRPLSAPTKQTIEDPEGALHTRGRCGRGQSSTRCQLPGLAAGSLERFVARIDLDDLRFFGHGVVDDAAVRIGPLPIAGAIAGGAAGAVDSRCDVASHRVDAVLIDGSSRPCRGGRRPSGRRSGRCRRSRCRSVRLVRIGPGNHRGSGPARYRQARGKQPCRSRYSTHRERGYRGRAPNSYRCERCARQRTPSRAAAPGPRN